MAGLCVLLALLAGCPAQNARRCETDEQCPGARCLRGACAPRCFRDLECPAGQICAAGSCAPRPQCAADSDCATGFACRAGTCQCTGDAACAIDQACLAGLCAPRPRCQSDVDCAAHGRRCEPTQGLCIPPCQLAADCAPGLDPLLAGALYQCTAGVCQRRCLTDQGCGSGLVCVDNACVRTTCQTFSDCPGGQYCTSATYGRCLPYQTCTTSAECPANFACRTFPPGDCPPGFPCDTPLCLELPACLIDADCPPSGPTFCQDRHCQPSTSCDAALSCPPGALCVAGTCVPGGCRGQPDCAAPQACVGGQCVDPPVPSDVRALAITPRAAILVVGESLQLTLVAYRADGSSFPLASADFAVLDEAGQPSGIATVDGTGRVIATAAGHVRVRGALTGSPAAPDEASLALYVAGGAGKRVVVLDAATRQPLAGVEVLGCDAPPAAAPCPAPQQVITDARGEAHFAFTGPTASFSVASPELRADGLPRYDRVSMAATTAGDLLLPLPENPVHGAAGFSASLSFAGVHTSGNLWLGFSALSSGDPADEDPQTLLGEPFQVVLPPSTERVAIPGSVVAYAAPGPGLPLEIKGRSYGLGKAGRRTAVAFAGRLDLLQLDILRSTDLLAYTGGMDYALQPFVNIAHRPYVPDATDLDGDGLCGDPQRCPGGPEDIPDYLRFPALSFAPAREQQQRTEVVLPGLPAGLDTAIVSSVLMTAEAGLVRLGFSSQSAGPPGPDGTRPVSPVVLRSGAPYGGVEVGQPGIWAQALAASQSGGSLSARITRGPLLPARVAFPPFLPVATGSTYSSADRTLGPGQPAWSAIAAAGGALGRLVLTGPDSRHILYFAIDGAQMAVRVPDAPPGAGVDAAERPGTWELSVIQLPPGTSAQDALDLPGPNLTALPALLDGYSRFRP